MNHEFNRQIPKMDALLALPAVQEAAQGLPRSMVKQTIQRTLDLIRFNARDDSEFPTQEKLEKALVKAVRRAAPWKLRRVINATGVVLHTNLGRAPLGDALAAHVAETAAGYSTLEYDLEAGRRGSRNALVEDLLTLLTGAEAAMVVNNNAAAVFLMLNTLCSGKTVAVSRGELVEIGGSFRIPEIMAASSARLHEIGTTNKTHLYDYEIAVHKESVGAILKVHTSNFRIQGFSEEVSIQQLSDLSSSSGIPLLYDLGAGFLVRPETLGLHDGVYIPDAVRAADVCCFSGDKLFGAGQAGILVGKYAYIKQMKQNQLARMLRVDKMTLASLEGALRLYADPQQAVSKLPVLRMLSVPEAELRPRAERLTSALQEVCPWLSFSAEPCTDEPGGGSLPGTELPGWCISITGARLEDLDFALNMLPVPIVGRISKDRLLLSVRTIAEQEEADLINGFAVLDLPI